MARTILHTNRWFSVSHAEDPATLDGAGWYEVERADSVMIVPVLKHGTYVMIHGVRRTCGTAPFFEFPAGGVDPDEDPCDAAARELREETGFRAGSLTACGVFVESPGLSSAKCHLFVARDLVAAETGLEPGENWSTVVVTREELFRELAQGGVRDGSTLAAIALTLIAKDASKLS